MKHDHGITDRGISSLMTSISTFLHLSQLRLEFIGCNEISDQSISKISSTISRLPELQNFEVHFKGCSHISDNGII